MQTDNTLLRLISDGVDKAKEGAAREVYDAVHAAASSIPPRSHYAFGWIIYYTLHQAPASEIQLRKKLLAEYLALSTPRPHKLHSMILLEAMRLYDDAGNAGFSAREGRRRQQPAFSIMRFSDMWRLDNLRPGDWRRREHEGKRLISTAEKLITITVDEAETTSVYPPEEFMRVVDRALADFPDSCNLLAQRAALHILKGERDDARRLLRNAILLAPGKFHLWSRLASLIPAGENPRLRLALYARALKAPGQQQFKGRIHLRLAEVWLSKGCLPQAAWELSIVETLYGSMGWHLPALHTRLRAVVPDDVTPESPEDTYRRVMPLADEAIYESLPEVKVRKTFHKAAVTPQPGSVAKTSPVAWRLTDDSGHNYWIQPRRFRLADDLPLGAGLAIRLYNGKPVAARITEPGN